MPLRVNPPGPRYHEMIAPEDTGAGRLVRGNMDVKGEDVGPTGVETQEDVSKAPRRGMNMPESQQLLHEANNRSASAAEGAGGKVL